MGEITDQTLRDYLIMNPRSNFDIVHNAAINELLTIRRHPNPDPSKRLHCNCPSCVCLLDVVEDEHG
jgi:hypothetical protein